LIFFLVFFSSSAPMPVCSCPFQQPDTGSKNAGQKSKEAEERPLLQKYWQIQSHNNTIEFMETPSRRSTRRLRTYEHGRYSYASSPLGSFACASRLWQRCRSATIWVTPAIYSRAGLTSTPLRGRARRKIRALMVPGTWVRTRSELAPNVISFCAVLCKKSH